MVPSCMEPAAKRVRTDDGVGPTGERDTLQGSNGSSAACADVPSEQLEFLKSGHCIAGVRHGGHGESNLLTHLTEVRLLLKEQLGCSDASLLGAALFHSIYGTEGFQGKVLSLSDRPKLRALIGERGEFIAYLNCVMDRGSLDTAVLNLALDGLAPVEHTIYTRAELGGEPICLSTDQLLDLMRVHFADWAQQVARYSFWSYRREAYATIATKLGGVFATLYSNIMVSEPENAEKNVPEMVRARRLGVFEQVLKGEIAYDDLIDDKVGKTVA
eukprot:TRINITY_DN33288_c0_g1_i1.p1 TRINITY_DN33288_c0_g1~~TRINITY_DN33288_c0_g1_i1.p1  ORF type:complete len:289 (-),score=35.83 TRINITY_DN33288_c0_g1_i1:66-881(-)